ncbi:free fatty acid receptor 2-like isoform X2 [Narcine bancroftii]|uniref:free fatty acid receptor 2-like isoform X2 n=1 Tax=Narcine bancroftii TaxID=1343680 RepID=UPI003831FABD
MAGTSACDATDAMTDQSFADRLHIAVYSVALLTGLPFNVLALCAFLSKARRKAGPNLVFLINLTISDLAFLLFLPFKIVESAKGSHWVLPSFLCPLSGLFYFSAIYSSILFLTALAVERYLGVAYPLRYKMCRASTHAVLASCLLWLCAFCHCSIVYITENQRSANLTGCYSNFSERQLRILLPVRLELGLVLFCLPLSITTFCYSGFIHILLSSPHISREKKCRAIGLVLTTLAVFLVCFGPYNLSHFVGYAQWRNPSWRTDALLLSTFNTSLDPVIFYFSSSAVKKACRGCVTSLSREILLFSPRRLLASSRRRSLELRSTGFQHSEF